MQAMRAGERRCTSARLFYSTGALERGVSRSLAAVGIGRIETGNDQILDPEPFEIRRQSRASCDSGI